MKLAHPSAVNVPKAVARARAGVDVSAISAAARIAGNTHSPAVFIDRGKIAIHSVSAPERPPNFALLELILGGICNTDLELQRGYYNFSGTPGHEFVARVIACDNPALLHKRVVGEINLACGHCDFCLRALGRHCRNRTVLGILGHPGAFARYFTLPEVNLHPVPDTVSDHHAVFAEPLAAACEILDQVPFEPGTHVAVLGDGKLGLLITQVLLAAHLQVTVYGRHEPNLNLARRAGASAYLAEHLPSMTYSYVVDCTGSPNGLQSAVAMTRPRGTIIMKSTIHQPLAFDMAPVIVNELTVVGSRCGRFEPAIALLEAGRLNLDEMIFAEYPLTEAPEAFRHAAVSGALKVLLRNA